MKPYLPIDWILVLNYVFFSRSQEAECEKARMDTKYAADTKIANSRRQFEMQKANFDMEVNARVSRFYGSSNFLIYFYLREKFQG